MIGIDIRSLQSAQKYQGVGNYTRGLLQGLASLNLPYRFILFYDRSLHLDFEIPIGLNAELVGIWRPQWEPRTREVWNQVLSPIEMITHKISLLHVTAPEYTVAWLPVPQIATIHDLILFGKFSPLKSGIKYRFLYKAAIKSDKVLIDSYASKQQLVDVFHPRKSDHIQVIYLGVDDSFFIQHPHNKIEIAYSKYGITMPYILYVGDLRSETHNARKNLIRLLEAFADTYAEYRNNWLLVFAGKRGDHASRLQSIAAQLGVLERVIFTDYIPDEDLPLLMAGASIFVYPSLDEGFGLPVLNAMAAGTPVLTSNRGSLPEICGDAALLIEPDHLESITEGLRCLMSDPGRREMMKHKGQKQAAQFTWAETARQTAQAYEAVLRTLK